MKGHPTILFWVFGALMTVHALHSGFEKSSSVLADQIGNFGETYRNCLQRFGGVLEDVEASTDLHFLSQHKFVNQLNDFIFKLNDDKDELYGALKRGLQEAVTIHSQAATFDIAMDREYNTVVRFVATMEESEMSPTLATLFRQFIGYKNVFFFTVGDIKTSLQNLIINTVNMFDTVETLMSKAMIDRASGQLRQLTPESLAHIPYLLGILEQLKQLDLKESKLIEHLAKNVVSMNQSLRDYDDAIEALNFYYKQRYVRGISDHLIENQLLEIEHEKAEVEAAAVEGDPQDQESSSSGSSEGTSEGTSEGSSEGTSVSSSKDGDSKSSKSSSKARRQDNEVEQNSTPSGSGQKDPQSSISKVRPEKGRGKNPAEKEKAVATKHKRSRDSGVGQGGEEAADPDVQGEGHKKSKKHKKSSKKEKKKSKQPIFRAGQTLEEALEAAQERPSFSAAAKREVPHPVKMCDKLILKNYGIEGLSVAEEVDPAMPLSPCERIQHSCCDQAAINRAFENYSNNQAEILQRTYEVAEQILDSLLGNYRKYNKVAYFFLQNEGTSHTCRELARKTVFMPVSRDFSRRFMADFRKAHTFSQRAKANYVCWVCNYDFQKQILARSEITLAKEFCSSMMDSHYSLLLTYHMQLVEYFNDVADLLQCDQESGVLTPEYAPKLTSPPEMTALLLRCSENKKYCLDLCNQFSFTSLKGPLEPNLEELKSFYYWMESKLEQLGDALEDDIDLTMGGFYANNYKIEKSGALDKRSISNLTKRFKNPQKGLLVLNPEAEGEVILSALSQGDDLTEFQ